MNNFMKHMLDANKKGQSLDESLKEFETNKNIKSSEIIDDSIPNDEVPSTFQLKPINVDIKSSHDDGKHRVISTQTEQKSDEYTKRRKLEALRKWSNKVSADSDTRVKIWTDPSVVINKSNKDEESKDIDDPIHQNDVSGASAVQKMGDASALDKMERLFKVKSLFLNSSNTAVNVKLADIQKSVPSVNRDTIIRYLKELHLRAYDDEKQEFIGASKRTHKTTMSRMTNTARHNLRYFTTNPDEGGIEITHAEYKALRQELIYKGLVTSQAVEAKQKRGTY